MEEIIKKAVDGGFEVKDWPISGPRVLVCDPLFWQALGKVCGWAEETLCPLPCCGGNCPIDIPGWESNALRFHEINLTEGWEKAVAYLTGITRGTALVN